MIRSSSSQVGPLSTSLKALSHPYSVVAVFTLAINDHILKGLAPGWLTGKLSDFAGLFFFPFLVTLLAALVRLPGAHFVGFGLTAIWFSAVKTIPSLAETMSSVFPWSSHIVHDPTDVIGLVSLVPAFVLWRSICSQRLTTAARRNARTIVAVTLAAATALATSATPPPELFALTQVGDVVYARVANYDDGLILGSEDAGSTWVEVEEPAAEALAAIQADVRFPAVRCENDEPNVCYAQADRPEGFEASSDGGITWRPLPGEGTPEVFGPPTSAYLELSQIGCDDSSSVCGRAMVTADGRREYEASEDNGATWTRVEPVGRSLIPNPEYVSGARCLMHVTSQCYRAVECESMWLRSIDGGQNWPEQTTEFPDVWRSYSSGDAHQVRAAACVSSRLCFRVFHPEGAPRPQLEESSDGGRTWQPSWRRSPRLAGPEGPQGVPVDLVVVGDPATLIVALGRDGIVRRTPDGDWQTTGAGPVPTLELPRVVEVAKSPLLGAAWLVALSLGLFGLSLLWQASPETTTARARPWWIGILPLTMGVAYIPLVAAATDDYPYGLLGGIADPVLFCLVAPFVLVVSTMIAGRRSDTGVLRRAFLTSMPAAFVAAIVMLVLLLFPFGFF